MKTRTVIRLFLTLIAIAYAMQSAAQDPLHWEDIRTGSLQSPVYIPPPPAFESGIRSASFSITYSGFTPDATAAFDYAAAIWSSLLNSSVPIKVNAYFIPLLPGLLGITLPNGRKDFSGAPLPATWYATALANSITDTELNTGESDFDLYLNSGINWYFGTDGYCPAGKYDLVSIALHEICHGLGFVGLAKVTGTTGSFGLLEAIDFAPITTSFPWPDLDTLPAVFDTKLIEEDGNFLITFPNPSTELKSNFTGNQVYFDGENASQMNNGFKPKMYAPSSFALGSSLVHLNESTYPAGNVNELMTPFSGASNAVHDPGPIVMGILKDIGWNVNYTGVPGELPAKVHSLKVFPNPASTTIWITGNNNHFGNFEVTDVSGHSILKLDYLPASISIDGFSNGMYIIRWLNDEVTETRTFLKY